MTATVAQRVVGISHIALGEVDRGKDFVLPGDPAGLLRTKTDLMLPDGIVTVVAGGPRKGEHKILPSTTKVMFQ